MTAADTLTGTSEASSTDTSGEMGEKITVAVLDFENNTSGARKEDLAGLQTGLTDMCITKLLNIKAFTVIERTRLAAAANYRVDETFNPMSLFV